ncbi:MAG: LolA family protein [Longimicrobiales bacterium]
MKRVLIALAFAGVAAAIALGARNHFVADESGADASASTSAPSSNHVFAPDTSSPSELRVDDPVRGLDTVNGVGAALLEREAREAGAAHSGSRPPAPADAGPTAGAPSQPNEGASAEAVLRRASAAYERVQSLQTEFVQRLDNPLLRSSTTSSGTIYQRTPDRFLMRFSDPEGDVIVSDGRHIWIYYPSVDPKQVLRTSAGAGGAGAVDLRRQFIGDPVARFRATLEGTEEVDGRSAHVLTLEPRAAAGYRALKVWIDTQDALVRRFEIREENGTVREFRLSDLRINPRLDDSLFRFEPPAGATVVDRG